MPFLLVLSSPSGGGKSTIARQLLSGRDDLIYSVSATTRPRREGETDGTHYHFLTEAQFDQKVAASEFAEWADYGSYRYGTLRSTIEDIVAGGHHAVLDIEIQGARQLRQQFPDAVMVFVLPPTGEILAARLTGRDTETSEDVARRLVQAQQELAAVSEYDYVVTNDDLVAAVEQVAAIIEAESLRVDRSADLSQRVQQLQRQVAEAAAQLST